MDEAVYRNIDSCLGIVKTTQSTFGPAGLNKIVINHIGKQFVTNDAATILKDLEVAHPAAKILVMAAHQQEQETGDGTNSVFQLAGALLDQAGSLLRMGAGVRSSKVIQGMAFRREAEGDVREVKDCKIAIYSCPLDSLLTETKGTVLLTTADELTQFSRGEENDIEKCLKAIAATGTNVIVTGGKVGDLALHYANRLGLMVVRLTSKFDIRRLCRATGATAMPKLTAPTPEELGHVSHVYTDEVADVETVVFEQDVHEGSVVTMLIRGSTENLMDDIERAVDDGVNTFKCLSRDARVVAGAGAVDLELARRLLMFAGTLTSLDQYSVCQFARAFEVVPRTLAANVGEKTTEVMAMLYVLHESGKTNTGLVIGQAGEATVTDAIQAGVYDLFLSKHWAIRFAVSAVCTVLRIDQIIMAKPAGGPKPREHGAPDED